MRRRTFIGLSALPLASWASKAEYPVVVPGRQLVFPRDHGAHLDFRTEWWYVTGWLDGPLGFQITFFRARPEEESNNPSSFNPRQILFAHAALADPKRGRLAHEERAARAGLSLAHAELDRTGVWIDDWRLELEGNRYQAKVAGREFDFDLTFFTSGKPLLQGEGGFSRKGHRPEEASYYYSRPHMNVAGKVNGKEASGTAWLDHEFEPLRFWKSPRTGASYPVSVRVKKDVLELRLEPLMDDQELDVRATSGTIYWEGAVTAYEGANAIGRGYLELTGYWKPMKL